MPIEAKSMKGTGKPKNMQFDIQIYRQNDRETESLKYDTRIIFQCTKMALRVKTVFLKDV